MYIPSDNSLSHVRCAATVSLITGCIWTILGCAQHVVFTRQITGARSLILGPEQRLRVLQCSFLITSLLLLPFSLLALCHRCPVTPPLDSLCFGFISTAFFQPRGCVINAACLLPLCAFLLVIVQLVVRFPFKWLCTSKSRHIVVYVLSVYVHEGDRHVSGR